MEDRWGHDGFKEMEESKDERKHHRSYDKSPRRESGSRSYSSHSRSPRKHSHRSGSRSRSPKKHSRRSSSRSPHGRHDSSHKRRRHHSRSPDSADDSRENGEKKDYKKQRHGYHEKTDTNEIKESERYDPRYSPVSPVNTSETKYGPDRSDFKEYQDDVAKAAPSQKYGPYPPPTIVHSQSNSHYQPNDDYEDQVEGRYGLESANEAPILQPSTTPKIDFSQYDDIPIEISGRDCPRGIEKFSDVDLGRVVLDNIKTIGYDRPTPVQKNSIPIVLGGRDLMACAQTGSGKTAAFLLPIISKLIHTGPGSVIQRKCFPLALVLAPTRELACQIQDECKKFAFKTGLKSTVVYGGSPIGYQLKALDYGCDILVATPGRLVDILERGKVSLSRIHFLVLDEADRMLDMGFEPQIRKIVEQQDMTPRGQRRTLMFSATFPKEIQLLASQFLEDYIFLAVGRVGSTTELVTQRFIKCEDAEKQDKLIELVQQLHGLTLIFVETKKQADMLGKFLARKGYPATSIHGDRAQKDRTTAIRTFSTGQTPFLVATNVAARGLDIENIAHVINYDMPGDIDDYVHRIGRTGRAGKAGISTSLITPANANLIPKLLELLEEADQQIPAWLGDMKYDRIHKKPRANGFGRGKFGGTDFRKEGGRFNPNMQRSNGPPLLNRYGTTSQNFPPPPPRDNTMGSYSSTSSSRMPTSSSSGAPPFPQSNGNGYNRQIQGPFPPPPPPQKPYSNGYPAPPNYPAYNHPPPPPPYGPVPPNSNRGNYPYKPY